MLKHNKNIREENSESSKASASALKPPILNLCTWNIMKNVLVRCMGTAFTTLILVLFIAIKAIINAKKSPVQGDRDPELEAQRDGRDPVSNASCNQPTQLTPPNISGLKADGGVGWL